MAGLVAVCALLALSCSILSLTAIQQWEPQWIYSVSISRNGHTEHCPYIGGHSWKCR